MKLSAPLVLRSFAPALFGLALGGCLIGSSSIGMLDDTGTSSASTSGDDGASDGSTTDPGATGTSTDGADMSDSATGSTGEAPPLSCAPPSPCTLPSECTLEGQQCTGGILSDANLDGCVRPTCTAPEDCAAGTTCLLPWSWGHCGHFGCADNPDGQGGGTCNCGFGADCTNNGFCVPDEAGLPPDTDGPAFCGQHTDAGACEGSLPAELGACRWYEGHQLATGAACEERVEVARCVFSTSAFVNDPGLTSCPGDASLRPMVRDEGGVLTVLFVDPEDLPTSIDESPWLACDDAGAQAECECGCP